MKTLTGKVAKIDIDAPIKKKDGGTYKGWRLTYTTDDGSLEKIEKHMNTLKYQPNLKVVLESLEVDDDFTVEMEKGDSGFWEVVSITKGADMPAPTQRTSEGTPKREYKSDKSGNWETADERAARQVMIVRQSSLGHAVALVNAGHGKPDAVLKIAEKFEAWVLRKEPKGEVAGEVE